MQNQPRPASVPVASGKATAPPASNTLPKAAVLVNIKAARGGVQVNQRAATLLRNHVHQLVSVSAATAIGGKNIARRAPHMMARKYSVGT